MVKNNRVTALTVDMFSSLDHYNIQLRNFLYPRTEGNHFNKAKSRYKLLRMLPLGICSYLKSVPRYKLLILGTHHSDTVYLREQGSEDPWLFFEVKWDPTAKKFGKHCCRVN